MIATITGGVLGVHKEPDLLAPDSLQARFKCVDFFGAVTVSN